MKPIIIMRKRFEFEDYPEMYSHYEVLEVPFPCFVCETSMLILDCEDLFLLKEDIQQTRHINPKCRIIVITPLSQISMVHSLFPDVGIVRRDVPLVFSSFVTGYAEERFPEKELKLSEREEKYLSYVSRGLHDTDIVDHIYISLRTLRRMKEQLYAKTGLSSSSQLAVFAVLHERTRKTTYELD